MNKSKIALFSGSFDPITNAHLDIIQRTSKIFDLLYIGVAINPNKSTLLPIETRVDLIKEECSNLNLSNVKVISYTGSTVAWAKEHEVSTLVRGIRSIKDFEYEKDLYLTNQYLDSSIDTIFIPSSLKYSFVSSTCIKELLACKGSISGLVSDRIKNALENLKK